MSLWDRLFGTGDDKPPLEEQDPASRPRPVGSQIYRFPVAGTSHYQDAIRQVVGKGGSDWRGSGFLVAEQDNKHDKNAVRVDIGNRKVGYLARDLAKEFQPGILRLGGRYAVTAECVGGTKGRPRIDLVLQFDPRALR